MSQDRRQYLDNLRTFLIFLVVVVHAGVVYESSGLLGPYWLVDDPETSDLPGLVNLLLDLFVMPTIFFISGYLAPSSLERHGSRGFVRAKLRRLVLPWAVAVLTLIPIYNAIYLVSRGLPQGNWTAYFHFTNREISMNWLWFLPVLFLFDVLYVVLRKLDLPIRKLSLGVVAVVVFVTSVGYSMLLSELGWLGWTKTPLVDFQNERVLPYFLIFLLGSFCCRRGVLEGDGRNMKLYVAVGATLWVPMNVYVIVLLNFFLRPGQYIVSGRVDGFVLWCCMYLSMLGLIYCAVTTFKYYFDRQGLFARWLGRYSYGVYIVHMGVMGPIALALLHVDLPALVKYPILALATYVGSNLLVWGYARTTEVLAAKPVARAEA
jgi:fucose 4-O-acetylase-like acetyltransferase